MDTCNGTKFSAENFIDYLLTEGKKVPCDETHESFKKTQVPEYYDEKLYKRGRAFFYDNIFGVMFNKLVGLTIVIALPEALQILMMTGKTSSDMTAYRRYLATVWHVKTWYDFDFTPGSRLLASVEDVKRKHNAASNKSIKKLKYRFRQHDMALTQFGFMGLALARGEMLGIHNPKEEDLKGFVHVWRVIGSIMGIEERFNMCRESVKETKEICDILIRKVFSPIFENPDKSVIQMTRYLINGLSAVDPLITYDLTTTYRQMLLENQEDCTKLRNKNYKNLSWHLKMRLTLFSLLMCWLQFKIVRLFTQYIMIVKLWISNNFPIFAYIKYGLKKGHVDFYKILYKSKKYN